MRKTEKSPLNKATEGVWKMIKSLFDKLALGDGVLCSVLLSGKVPKMQLGSRAATKSFTLHTLPPDQELRRQRRAERKRHLPAPNTHGLQSANRQAVRKIKFESENPHTLKVSVVLRLNAEAGRDTILESSAKRW